jgi:hypothetical protein
VTIRLRKCWICKLPERPDGECLACRRSWHRWLRSHDGTMSSAVAWSKARRQRIRRLATRAPGERT